MSNRSTTRLNFLPPLLVGLAVVCTPLLALAEPVQGNQVAAVFPPGWTHRDVLLASASADQTLIRFGSLANIGIVEISSESDMTRLRQAGALLLLDPQALGGCLIGTSPSQQIGNAP